MYFTYRPTSAPKTILASSPKREPSGSPTSHLPSLSASTFVHRVTVAACQSLSILTLDLVAQCYPNLAERW